MTLLTKQQIEALREGTTPGPWRAEGEPWNRIVWSSAENRVCFMAHSNGLDDARDIATSNLVAAAPAIAHTALDALARLEDAKAAQALVVEWAADVALPTEQDFEAGDDEWNSNYRAGLLAASNRIRALAPASGVEALAALRAERDDAKRLMGMRHREMLAADGLMRKHQRRAEKAEAERDDLRARLAAAEAQVAALRAERDELKQKLISPDPYEDTAHFDDHSVNRFAAVMKGKLASKRLQGRGGWQAPEVPNGYLSRLLREHVDKGDPVDVANFAMMIHQRGERIAPENEGASCKAIDKAEAERDAALAHLAAAEGRMAALTEALNKARDPGRQPDYCYDEEWEYTMGWDHWADLVEYHDLTEPVPVYTLYKGPTRWAVNVPNSWENDGTPDGWDVEIFDSEAAARAALATVTPPADTTEGGG